MAEPLTSSDIIRERMGFGVSPLASMETRRSYAAAGLSPLGTQERERFEEGRGISPMATRQEQEAWKQAEFMAGRREQAPISYGGIGDRPIGTSRRDIRMQAEWDKQQQEQLQKQRIMQEMDLRQKEYEMQQRDQQLQESDFYYNRGLKEAEQKLQAEQRSQATSIIGALNQLDPRDPDYRKKVGDVFASNPLGATDDGALKVAEKYGVVNELYMESAKTQATGIKEAQDKYAEDMQKLMESGVTEEELPQYINPRSPVGLPMFDPLKVAARLGTTKAQEKAETKTTKEETSKEKVGLDYQQAAAELNEVLMAGGEPESAQTKVAGLRARYKAITGEEAPEVLPQPQNEKQRARLPSGTFYLDPKGVRRQIP